jgi:hypothetical protein
VKKGTSPCSERNQVVGLRPANRAAASTRVAKLWIAHRNCLRLTKESLGRKGLLSVEPQSGLSFLILLNELRLA